LRIAGLEKMTTMLEDIMQGDEIPTEEEFMAATHDERDRLKCNLLFTKLFKYNHGPW
jgi:hypothetical protein